MPKCNENSDESEQAQPVGRIANWRRYFRKLAKRSQWILLFTSDRIELGRNFAILRNIDLFGQDGLPTRNVVSCPANSDRHAAPCEHDHSHHGCCHHDLERLAARLVNSEQVLV